MVKGMSSTLNWLNQVFYMIELLESNSLRNLLSELNLNEILRRHEKEAGFISD